MPVVIGFHDVKDSKHWLASSKREEFFGPLGVTGIRTFVDPQNPNRVVVVLVGVVVVVVECLCLHAKNAAGMT